MTSSGLPVVRECAPDQLDYPSSGPASGMLGLSFTRVFSCVARGFKARPSFWGVLT
jgi:hypothetical protein